MSAANDRRPTELREDGIALVKVLLLSTVMLALATLSARGTRLEMRIAQNDLLAERALFVAEAGVHHVHSLIRNTGNPYFTPELQNQGTGGALASLGIASGGDRFVAYSGSLNDGYYVHVENNDGEIGQSATVDEDHAVKIVSRGVVAGAERVIEAVVTKDPAFGDGLCGRVSVTIGGGSVTDSYNSSAGAYGGSNVGSNGNVCSNGPITLNGSPSTINGDASTAGNVNPGSGTITGLREESRVPVYDFPPVNSPCTGFSNGSGISGGTYHAAGPNAGELTGNPPGPIVLASNTYCLKSITISNALTTLTVNGPVVIYLTDISRLEGGGVINTTGIPANLQIYSSYVSTNTTQGLTINGGTSAYLAVYAPNTAVTFTSNTTHIYGAIVGGDVSVSGNTQFHFDEALDQVVNPFARIASWKEVRG